MAEILRGLQSKENWINYLEYDTLFMPFEVSSIESESALFRPPFTRASQLDKGELLSRRMLPSDRDLLMNDLSGQMRMFSRKYIF